MSRHLPENGEPEDPITRAELISGAVTLAGVLLALIGTALVVFQSGRPTLASSGTGIVLFLVGAVVTGVSTVLPGEPQDLWTAWKARRAGPR
jgi:drug/metabolite transporter (DMT)-like permease